MKTSRNSIVISSYDLAVVLMAIKVMLDRIVYIDVPDLLDAALIVFSLGLFIVTILFENIHYLGEWLMIIGLGAISTFACIRAGGEYFMLLSIILIISSVNKDIKHVIELSRNVKLIGLMISTLWYLFAYFVKNDTKYVVIKEGRICHHFGFSHPNSFAIILCWIMLETLFIAEETKQKKLCILFPFIGVVTYYLTSCDTIMIILLITSILYFLNQYQVFNNVFYQISKVLFPILAFLNATSIIVYSQKKGNLFNFVYKMDAFLTSRIRQAAWIYEHYGISIVGQKLPFNKKIAFDSFYRLDRLMLDGLYSNLFLSLGLLFTILFSIMIFHSVKKNRSWSIITLVFSVYGIIETHGINAYIAFPLFAFGATCINDYHDYLAGLRGNKK